MSTDPNGPAGPEPTPAEGATFPAQPIVPAVTRVPVKPRKSSAAWLNVLLVLAALVAVGGVTFAIGRGTAPVAGGGQGGNDNFAGGNDIVGGNGGHGAAPDASGEPEGFGDGFGGAGFNLTGTVQSVTGDTLTITTANGRTLELTLGADTTYNTQTPASASDVKNGTRVEVQLQPGAGDGALLRPNGSAAPSGPIGTASSVTVVP